MSKSVDGLGEEIHSSAEGQQKLTHHFFRNLLFILV